MDFFQKLFDTGEVDITMRIMKKNDKLTINIMPGSKVSKLQPIIITGTPAELDAEFFSQVLPGVNEVKGLISNLEAVKKEAAPNPKPAEKLKDKKAATAKDKTKKKKAPEAKEASLFEQPAADEDQSQEQDAVDDTKNDASE